MEQKWRKVAKSFAMITQIGISMMVPVFLGAAAGWWLDKWFHTEFLFVLMLVLGAGAAFRNIWVLTKTFYAADMKEEHKKLQYMDNLRNYREEHPEEEFGDVLEGKKKRYSENRGETRH